MKQYSVTEIFGPTMQGEGPMAGVQTMFLRLHFCDSSCSWCDSRYTWDKDDPAFSKFRRMTADEIVAELEAKSRGQTNVITVTGGNPMIQLDVALAKTLRTFGRIQIETQGTLFKKEILDLAETIVVSPKSPSSGQPNLSANLINNWCTYAEDRDNVSFKIVVFDEIDFDWAIDFFTQVRNSGFLGKPKLYLQAGTATSGDPVDVLAERYSWLVKHWLESKKASDAIVLPQLHVLVWGRTKGV